MGRYTELNTMMEKAKQQKIRVLDEQMQRTMSELVQSAFEHLEREDSLIDEYAAARLQAESYQLKEITQAASDLVDYNVTEQFIREKWQLRRHSTYRTYFSGFDREALVFFISGQSPDLFSDITNGSVPTLPEALRLTPEAVFEQMNELSSDRQLDALVWLYPYGLRADHLRAWRNEVNDNIFLLGHSNALKALVLHGNRSVENAMRLLQGKSDTEAWQMWLTVIHSDHTVIQHPHRNATRLEEIKERTLSTQEARHRTHQIPDELICPISGCIMDEPVNIPGEAHAFEKVYLERWFKIKHTNPLTNLPTNPASIVVNEKLKADIENFIKNYEHKCQISHGFLTAFWGRKNPTDQTVKLTVHCLPTKK